MRTLLLVLIACLLPADCARGQEAPLTRLVPVATETGFVAEAVKRVWRIEPTKKYHYSGCQVSCPNGACGSGMFVQTDNDTLVAVTNHHVIEGNTYVNIVAWNDQRTNARVVWSDPQADVAILVNEESKCRVGVPIYDGEVPVGADVSVVSFGGPGTVQPSRDRRVFIGRNLGRQMSARVVLDSYTVSGDSGSGYCYDGALVGVNWGHFGHPQITVSGWGAGKPCASNVDGPWLARTLTQVCTPFGCRPIIRRPVQPQPQPLPPTEVPDPETPDQVDVNEVTGLTQEDVDAAIAAAMAKLPPQVISLALVDESGNIVDQDTVPIGGTLKLQFREVKRAR